MTENDRIERVPQYQMISVNIEIYNKLLDNAIALGFRGEIKNPDPVAEILGAIADIETEKLAKVLPEKSVLQGDR